MKNKTFYILLDTSSSMQDSEKHSRATIANKLLSQIVVDILPKIFEEKDSELELFLAVLAFSTEKIEWYIPRTNIESLLGNWVDIDNNIFGGDASTGEAIKIAIDDMNINLYGLYGEKDPDAIESTILLLSAGESFVGNPSYEEALQYNNKENPNYYPPFRYSTRVAIGIQADEKGKEELKKFGRISSLLIDSGFKSYYDSDELDAQTLFDILDAILLYRFKMLLG